MTEPVPRNQIESIVGARRHPSAHLGCSVSAERRFYILHSQRCRDTTPDLRACPYSLALDRGIDPNAWPEDEPVTLLLENGRLTPDLVGGA